MRAIGKMPVYNYHAKDSLGRTVSGEIMAEDERMAVGQIRELGYYPMRVLAAQGSAAALGGGVATRPLSPGLFNLQSERQAVKPQGSWFERTFIYPIWTNVSLAELAVYFREFSALLNAGMSIVAALGSLQTQKSGVLRKISAKMRAHVLAGGTLSEAMGMYPHIFSEMQQKMIVAAENTGGLDDMMRRLADYLEADYALRRMVKRETFMPKINLVATFLLPQLVVWVMHGGGAYFHEAVVPLLRTVAYLAAVYAVGRFSLSIRPIAVLYDTIKSYLPYFGYTVRMLALAKFSRALSALYSGGVLLPTAVATASEVSGNAYLSHMMGKAVPAMMASEGLTESFAQTGAFPPMFLSMLGTGEHTGNLDGVLSKVAEFYEAESAQRLHQSVQALGILAFLAAAFIVGREVIAFYTGMGAEYTNIMNEGN